MTDVRFRQLLILYIACIAAEVAAAFLPGSYSQGLAEAFANEPEPMLFQSRWLLFGLLVPLVCASVAGLVGLFLFKPWGRSISLCTTLAALALTPLAGPMLSSSLEAAFWGASELIWGAILASAYFSPVAARFGAYNAFKANPLRGSA